jgi:Uma2 family endonuclease
MREGVREYWVVNPESERVEIYPLGGDPRIVEDVLTTPLLPSLKVVVRKLFEAR